MAEKFYFLGHETLTNRGCEALLRGISSIIRERLPDAEFLAPSFDIRSDQNQFASYDQSGISFIPAYSLPFYTRIWGKLDNIFGGLKQAWIPSPAIPDDVKKILKDTSAGIMTGGDVLSLDYGVPSLTKFVGQAESYMDSDRPMYLWAASVGPFDLQPAIEKYVMQHLARYAGISVRETSSFNYLKKLGFENVKLVADPAFVMTPEPWGTSAVVPVESGEGVLGFNISPLIKSFRYGDSHVFEMETGVIEFLQDVIARTNLSVMLIPHVDTVDGGEWNSDYLYMLHLITRINLPESTVTARISLAPRNLNAVQTKFLISQCRFFIGARTHATIAAWSTQVPTISIAYSIKAIGLNTDLFGDLRYVLETPKLSRDTLWESLDKLRSEEQGIKTLLNQKIPQWQQRAREAGDQILTII